MSGVDSTDKSTQIQIHINGNISAATIIQVFKFNISVIMQSTWGNKSPSSV